MHNLVKCLVDGSKEGRQHVTLLCSRVAPTISQSAEAAHFLRPQLFDYPPDGDELHFTMRNFFLLPKKSFFGVLRTFLASRVVASINKFQ
jgi:hypothetical protein